MLAKQHWADVCYELRAGSLNWNLIERNLRAKEMLCKDYVERDQQHDLRINEDMVDALRDERWLERVDNQMGFEINWEVVSNYVIQVTIIDHAQDLLLADVEIETIVSQNRIL